LAVTKANNMVKAKKTVAPSSSPFMKMKLVPFDCEQKTKKKKPRKPYSGNQKQKLSDELEKHVRHADPIVTAMSKSLPYIAGMPPMERKKLGSASSVAVQNAHLERYKNLERLRESAQFASPPILPPAPLMSSQPPPPPPPQPPSPQPMSKTVESGIDGDTSVNVMEPAVNIPKAQRKKFESLLSFLDSHPSKISRSGAGELVLDGRTIRGTNYNQAFRGLYVNTKESPPGLRELVVRLKRLGVPDRLFSSKNAKIVYDQIGHGKRSKAVKRVKRINQAPVLRVY
jgi:hypothetical protein